MKAKIFTCLFVVLASCSQHVTTQNTSKQMTTQTATRIVKPADLQTGEGKSTAVISNAQKFIIPIPVLEDGEPLVYPKDQTKAGEPILDYEGKPIGKSGIVFFNYEDKTVQAAPGDGRGVVIINEVTEEQANALYAEIGKFGKEPANWNLRILKSVIAFAHNQLGLSDMYNSTQDFIKENMTDVSKKDKHATSVFGFKKRDDRDVLQAIYIPGAFIFEGPAATPQQFENGGVIVEQGGKMRGIQPDIFLRTYRFANGTFIISIEKLKKQLNKY